MKHFHSKSFHLAWILAIIAAGAAMYFIRSRYPTVIVDFPKFSYNNLPAITKQDKTDPNLALSPLPSTLLLPVPFTPQAPTANWDELHNEACEEASVIMAMAYYNNNDNNNLPSEYVESEIAKLTDWQEQTFGYHLSINTQETVRMIKEVYGLNAEIIENFTADDIKKSLTEGKLILLPANGRLLGNPNYKSPGPIYHMLVIRGYTSSAIITNDPGTRKGLNYPYTFDVLYNANGDYSHETKTVDLSKKMVIAVWK